MVPNQGPPPDPSFCIPRAHSALFKVTDSNHIPKTLPPELNKSFYLRKEINDNKMEDINNNQLIKTPCMNLKLDTPFPQPNYPAIESMIASIQEINQTNSQIHSKSCPKKMPGNFKPQSLQTSGVRDIINGRQKSSVGKWSDIRDANLFGMENQFMPLENLKALMKSPDQVNN
jgi:hypothetical protein